MCTGSQGEPLSALARIANGEHRTIQMDEGDTVIVSATPVPGNEKAVTRVINGLAKIGADVYDKNRARMLVWPRRRACRPTMFSSAKTAKALS